MSSINHMQFSNVVWHYTEKPVSPFERIDMITTSKRESYGSRKNSFMVFMLSITITIQFYCLCWLKSKQSERERERETEETPREMHSKLLYPFIWSVSIHKFSSFCIQTKNAWTEYCIIDWKQCQHHWPLCRCNTIHTQCTPVNDVQ